MNWPAIMLIGAAVGFMGGLFGKGGSAIATPLLAAVGVPPILAVAAPLPATIPGTLVAARPYVRGRFFDRAALGWSLVVAIVATVIGSVATHWINGSILVTATDVVVAALGLRFLFKPRSGDEVAEEVPHRVARTVAVAAVVGLAAGLLANSGGFLLAPLYLAVLRLPIKPAFGTSLIVSCVLAVPGTMVHAALGQVDWTLVLVFGAASVPLSAVGARVGLRSDAARLERVYGAVLATLGISLLLL
ncbi:MAG TPA: sulfite exporter TauE/SafE family protein [Acidimicrobiales bacterium]